MKGIEQVSEDSNLSVLIKKDWFTDLDNSSVWMQIFTSLLMPWDVFIPSLEGAITQIELDSSVGISFLHLDGLKLNMPQAFMLASEDGTTCIQISSFEKEFSYSNYIALTTPYVVDEHKGDYVETRNRLAIASSLITSHLGFNFMRDKIYDGQVSAGDGKMGGIAQAKRIPQPTEGPFIHKDNWDDIEEISQKLFKLQIEKRNRILLGLSFFDKAIRQDNSFFNYWTALEIICNGKSQAIKHKIKQCYDFSLKDVEDCGFAKIAKWRHDYFHKGIEIELSVDVERYIQLLILDLLRFEIGLPLKGHIAEISVAAGYDLSPIGLINRKPG